MSSGLVHVMQEFGRGSPMTVEPPAPYPPTPYPPLPPSKETAPAAADGGQAFPMTYEAKGGPDAGAQWIFHGMTLRDYFAAAALQGMASYRLVNGQGREVPPAAIASQAYVIADAMLAERAKGGQA